MPRAAVAIAPSCPCRGLGLDRFLIAAILIQLVQDDCHGYQILARINEDPVGKADAGGVYRALRAMERRGLCQSRLETGERGPRKRRYGITPAGRVCLESWMQTLAGHRALLDRLISAGQEALRGG